MQLPIQITFRNMESSPAVEARIREEAEKFSEFYDHIMGCRVMVEIPHQHRHRGKRFHIRIDLTVPGGEIVVKHEPSLHDSIQQTETEKRKKEQEIAAPHKEIYVAIRDAFKAARRRLQDYARKQSGAVKRHEPAPRAHVSRLFPEEGYGYLEIPEGSEIYFHKNSVLNDGFGKLAVGTEVSFVEEAGDKGPQASTVRIIGKRRRAGRE
ncbi:MAG: HPF/RaiA family ribosome-associated protein [Acidobacteria bacterium]|nr:HPF/RaiA family ribosome-associated protein [Acidobacteriota bacterium]